MWWNQMSVTNIEDVRPTQLFIDIETNEKIEEFIDRILNFREENPDMEIIGNALNGFLITFPVGLELTKEMILNQYNMSLSPEIKEVTVSISWAAMNIL